MEQPSLKRIECINFYKILQMKYVFVLNQTEQGREQTEACITLIWVPIFFIKYCQRKVLCSFTLITSILIFYRVGILKMYYFVAFIKVIFSSLCHKKKDGTPFKINQMEYSKAINSL